MARIPQLLKIEDSNSLRMSSGKSLRPTGLLYFILDYTFFMFIKNYIYSEFPFSSRCLSWLACPVVHPCMRTISDGEEGAERVAAIRPSCPVTYTSGQQSDRNHFFPSSPTGNAARLVWDHRANDAPACHLHGIGTFWVDMKIFK
ncbi:hypothetical protein CDAR_441371 [Caerostris darwini]|uniref:Uncharacterized protein n=1 Tax=Caerostris darwini TaxID=1538125 RepID=A0AAV4TQG9_9ARAC|nr:hypothetical protein CDAR_441371 [Caerostris darwini]